MKYIIFYFDQNAPKILVENTTPDGQKTTVLSSHNNFVSKDEIVAKVISVDDPEEISKHIDIGHTYFNYENYFQIKAGEGIYYDDAFRLIAKRYGFVKLDRTTSKISLVTPLKITANKMKAYYLTYPTKFKKLPDINEIEETLVSLKVYSMVDRETLTNDLKKIDTNNPKLTRLVVASGREPVNGYEEHFLPIIDIEKKAGKILQDGRIDFKELDSIIEIKKNQPVLKKVPRLESSDGYDIYGVAAKGDMVANNGYKAGKDFAPTHEDPLIYASVIDGCLEIIKKTIKVSPVSIIKGDVDYDTGNIDFSGSVHVKGSVLPGFSVKAKGNIIVEKNVDDARIDAGGNITVKLGISGKGNTKVTAHGNIKTKYILNADVEALGIIEVSDSIINSHVFSNDKIIVTERNGKIIGGETTALCEIIVNESGVPSENKTTLSVGRNIFVELELAEIKKQMEPVSAKVHEITERLKASFGTEVLTNTKKFISILPPAKKKTCITLISELAAATKELNELTNKYNAAEESLKFEKEPSITIINKIHPGTILKIKKSVFSPLKEIQNAKFYEHPQDKVIRFSPAV